MFPPRGHVLQRRLQTFTPGWAPKLKFWPIQKGETNHGDENVHDNIAHGNDDDGDNDNDIRSDSNHADHKRVDETCTKDETNHGGKCS